MNGSHSIVSFLNLCVNLHLFLQLSDSLLSPVGNPFSYFFFLVYPLFPLDLKSVHSLRLSPLLIPFILLLPHVSRYQSEAPLLHQVLCQGKPLTPRCCMCCFAALETFSCILHLSTKVLSLKMATVYNLLHLCFKQIDKDFKQIDKDFQITIGSVCPLGL